MSRAKRNFSVVVRDEQSRQKALHVLSNLKLGNTPLEVVIKPYRENRSVQQNALLWKWITIIAEELGDTKDAIHEQMKRKYLKPLLYAEDEKFREIIERLRAAWRDGHKELAEQMECYVMLETSTAVLNVKQMTEYLQSILDHARSLDISLPIPQDRRRL